MRPTMRRVRDGIAGEPFLYEVGYSLDLIVQIVHHVNRGPDGHLRRCWQSREIIAGQCGEWTGNFKTAEEAYQSGG